MHALKRLITTRRVSQRPKDLLLQFRFSGLFLHIYIYMYIYIYIDIDIDIDIYRYI